MQFIYSTIFKYVSNDNSNDNCIQYVYAYTLNASIYAYQNCRKHFFLL